MDNRPRVARVYEYDGKWVVIGTHIPGGVSLIKICGKTGKTWYPSYEGVYLNASGEWLRSVTPYSGLNRGEYEELLAMLGYKQSTTNTEYWHLNAE